MDYQHILRKALESSKDHRLLRDLIREAEAVLGSENGLVAYRQPGVYTIRSPERVFFIGDLHGDYYALANILARTWSDFTDESTAIVFLGDYVDRGYAQIETLAAVLQVKLAFPERTALLRGNHEPLPWLIPSPHDFPDVLRARFGQNGPVIYELLSSLFEKLALYALVNTEILAVHGGPPPSVMNASSLQEALRIDEQAFPREDVEAALWSDPIGLDVTYLPSPRGAGYLYGKSVIRHITEKLGLRAIVRGHEAVNGVEKVDDALYTVFSAPMVYELSLTGLLLAERTGETYVYRDQSFPVGKDVAQ